MLTDGDHAGRVYELDGEAFTQAELAEAVAAATGQDIAHHDVSLADFRQTMLQAGLPTPLVAMLVGAEAAIAAGALDTTSTDLADLLGRRPTTLRDALTATAS